MTLPTQAVLRALLHDPSRALYGLEVCELAGLPSGTIHPILIRLEKIGWLESRWEDIEAHEHIGRPRRRYYSFTQDGAEQARLALAAAYQRKPARAGLAKPQVAR